MNPIATIPPKSSMDVFGFPRTLFSFSGLKSLTTKARSDLYLMLRFRSRCWLLRSRRRPLPDYVRRKKSFLTISPAPSRPSSGIFPLLRVRRLLLIGLIILGMALAEGAANDWLPLIMVDSYGYDQASGSLIFFAFAVAMTLGRFSGGFIFEPLRTSRCDSRLRYPLRLGYRHRLYREQRRCRRGRRLALHPCCEVGNDGLKFCPNGSIRRRARAPNTRNAAWRAVGPTSASSGKQQFRPVVKIGEH